MDDSTFEGLSSSMPGNDWQSWWIAALILVVGILISIAMKRVCDHQIGRLFPFSSAAGRALVGRLLRLSVLVVSALVALEVLGVSITSLMAAGTMLFVGFGLAVQKILQSLVAGTLILAEREIEPRDIIRFEGEEYRVVRIGLRTTQLESRYTESLILPNYLIATCPVVNLTHRGSSVRLRFDVQVAYGSDSEAVERALLRAAESISERTQEAPQILLTSLGDHGVNWSILVGVEDPWNLPRRRSELGRRVLDELEAADIPIPYPQLDVHLPEAPRDS